MMYVNVACTCGAQVILSFIFSIMSEPVEILDVSDGERRTMWEIRRDNLLVFRQECDAANETANSAVYNAIETPNTAINAAGKGTSMGLHQDMLSDSSNGRSSIERNMS